MSNMSNEQKMTREEEITMFAALTRRLLNQTSEYVETVQKTLQTYPELKKAFDIVIAMDMFDHSVVRCITCSSDMRDKFVVELQRL